MALFFVVLFLTYVHLHQGKSLSLICASITWLRHHKSSQFEESLHKSAEEYKDEPSWVVEQYLRRKRDELVGRWEDREKRLEAHRLKEKALEERSRKRRRVEDPASFPRHVDDEDAEWLLDNVGDYDTGSQDALYGLSKESRDVLASIGLGGAIKKEEEEDLLEENIKVRAFHTIRCAHRDSNISRFTTLQEHILSCRNSSPNSVALHFLRRYHRL